MSTPTELLSDLERCPYFKGIDQDVLHAVAVFAETVRARDGKVIARQGDPAESMWLLVHGEVVVRGPGEGGEEVVRARLRPGMLVGHVELLAGEKRATTWVARGSTRLLQYDRKAFERLIGDPSLIGSTFRRALILAQTNQLIAANGRLRQALDGEFAPPPAALPPDEAVDPDPWLDRDG